MMLEWMNTEASIWEIVLRLMIALAVGAIVGFEREWRDQPAGLRTHMLVALGSAGFMLLAMEFYEMVIESGRTMTTDPLRVMQGVVGGVGFLGAGTIIHAGGRVRGLTTAAGLWAVAAVGVAAGAGQYDITIIMAVLIVLTLAVIRFAEHPIARHRRAAQRDDDDERERDAYREGAPLSHTAHGPFEPREK
jgi:putative Mg2+ transporter-C (MgtC) family protein